MLAINHVTLATGLAFAASVYFKEPFFLPFIVFVAFAGLAPDVDHPNSELGRQFKFLADILPHRGVTHSLFGASLFCLGLYFLLGYNQILSLILILFAFIGVTYLEKLLHHRVKSLKKLSAGLLSYSQINFAIKSTSIILNIFLGMLVFLIWKSRFRFEILILLLFGYLAHILGDFVTIEGVPLFWPIKKKFGLKLFKTGGLIEGFIGFLLIVGNVYFIYNFSQMYNVQSEAYWRNYLDFSNK